MYRNEGEYNEEFKQIKVKERDQLVERDIDDKPELNSIISREEVQKMIDKAKAGKAVGIDYIPNEALKNGRVVDLLHVLFKNLFEYGQIPKIRKKSIIHPIPKGSGKEVRPLLFRGLALQSCIYKLYSAIINPKTS